MEDNNGVGTLEEESIKRKERLKALKRKHEEPDTLEKNKNSENSKSVNLPKPKFRSYRPQDENLKQQVLEDAKPGNVESEIQSHLEAAKSKVVIEELDDPSEKNYEGGYDDLEGEEEYVPNYVCVKKEVPQEEICFSEVSSCSEARTTTGNILDRIIKDPTCRRPPCLGKWAKYPPKSDTNFEDNFHQYKAAQQNTVLGQMCSLEVTSEPNLYRQPKIVATIGPSSSNSNDIKELLEAGTNIFRVNMAHGDPCFQNDAFQSIIEASNHFRALKDYEIPISTMMDLKGPEIRTGRINPRLGKDGNTVELCIKKGSYIRLTSDELFKDRCTDKTIYIDYPGLASQVLQGMPIYISDGEIKLRVNLIENAYIVCQVENGGTLKNAQKVHIPMLPALLPTLSDYDIECIELAKKMNVDVVVVPKVRNAEIVKQVKKLLGVKQEEHPTLVMAKISNFEGLENIDYILRVADGIVLQKNDLCLEVTPEKMFIAQKEVIGKCNRMGKPIFCTAQLNCSKTLNNHTTRMEMSDIASAILDGADGIILISETAVGDQGAQTVTYLSDVIKEAEAATMQKPFYFDLVDEQNPSIEPCRAIALAAVQIATKIQATAILTVTTSGKTAHLLSWFRPRQPVIAVSRVGRTARQMNLWRAIIPLHFTAPVLPDWFQDVKTRFEYGISYGRDHGIIQSGDLLVLVSGYRKGSGFTNCIRVVFAAVQEEGFAESISTFYSSSKSTPPKI